MIDDWVERLLIWLEEERTGLHVIKAVVAVVRAAVALEIVDPELVGETEGRLRVALDLLRKALEE